MFPVNTLITLTSGEGRNILLPNTEKDTLYATHTTRYQNKWAGEERGKDGNPYNRTRFNGRHSTPRYKNIDRTSIRYI